MHFPAEIGQPLLANFDFFVLFSKSSHRFKVGSKRYNSQRFEPATTTDHGTSESRSAIIRLMARNGKSGRGRIKPAKKPRRRDPQTGLWSDRVAIGRFTHIEGNGNAFRCVRRER